MLSAHSNQLTLCDVMCREDLTSFGKDELKKAAWTMRDQTMARPMISTWRDDIQPEHRPPIALLQHCPSAVSAFAFGSDVCSGEGRSISSDAMLLIKQKGVDLEDSASQVSMISFGQRMQSDQSTESGYYADIAKSLPVLGEERSSVIRRPSQVLAEEGNGIEGPPVDAIHHAQQGVASVAIEQGQAPCALVADPSGMMPKMYRSSITESSVDASSQQSTHANKLRISNINEPSKALRLFEEYKKSQEGDRKAELEGRKKANKNSKFRLTSKVSNATKEVSLEDINRKRWEAEWTLFHTMFPNVTQKNQYAFIEAFRRKYPDATIRADIRILTLESISLNYPSVGSTDDLSVSQQQDQGSMDSSLPPMDLQHANSMASGTSVVDTALLDWQKYTVESIVKAKEGERKILPNISTKVTNPRNKRYRSNRVEKTYVPLVKLAAKKDEEPIPGPTSYLQLYKGGSQVYITAAEKKKVLEEMTPFRSFGK
jgi:hypothetical protein